MKSEESYRDLVTELKGFDQNQKVSDREWYVRGRLDKLSNRGPSYRIDSYMEGYNSVQHQGS